MTFSTEIKEAAQPIIEEIYNDGFIPVSYTHLTLPTKA